MTYYNEFDPKAAAWLRELIKQGHIAQGIVDERSITDVKAHELRNYTSCHFFAGIGGWSKALRLAGVKDEEPRDTGSCPCQPFSDAGKGGGEADPRHLWPAWFNIIRERRPATIYGEQVASKNALRWWDGVSSDLESEGYATVAFDLCSAGVGAPTIRQRLFWVAYRMRGGRDQGPGQLGEIQGARSGESEPSEHSSLGGLDNSTSTRLNGSQQEPEGNPWDETRVCVSGEGCGHGFVVPRGSGFVVPFDRLGDAFQPRLEGHAGDEHIGGESGWVGAHTPGSIAQAGNARRFYDRFDLCLCTDGKARRIEPGSFPLVAKLPGRVALLRGAGNAINVELAAEFIRIAEESIDDLAVL